jgi:hypothetical protein
MTHKGGGNASGSRPSAGEPKLQKDGASAANGKEPAAGRLLWEDSICMKDGEDKANRFDDVGLCRDCSYGRRVGSAQGSTFYLCERSCTDPQFPKYPRLPVVKCLGYARVGLFQED